MKPNSLCPGDEVLAQFAEGSLPAPDRRGVILHLDHCPDCREITAANLKLLDARSLSPANAPSKRPKPFRPWLGALLPLAAALAIALILQPWGKGASSYELGLAKTQASLDAWAAKGSPALQQYRLSLVPSPNAISNPTRGSDQGLVENQAEAMALLEKVDPSDASFRQAGLHRISLKLAAGEYAGALELVEFYQKTFPQDLDLGLLANLSQYLLALDLQRENDANLALEGMLTLRRRFPEDAVLAYNLGSMLWTEKRFQEAEAVWQTYLQQFPDDAYAERIRKLTESP